MHRNTKSLTMILFLILANKLVGQNQNIEVPQIFRKDSICLKLPEGVEAENGEIKYSNNEFIISDKLRSRYFFFDSMGNYLRTMNLQLNDGELFASADLVTNENIILFFSNGTLRVFDREGSVWGSARIAKGSYFRGNPYDAFSSVAIHSATDIVLYYPVATPVNKVDFRFSTEKYRHFIQAKKTMVQVRIEKPEGSKSPQVQYQYFGSWPSIFATSQTLRHMEMISLTHDSINRKLYLSYAPTPLIEVYSESGELLDKVEKAGSSIQPSDSLRLIREVVQFDKKRISYNLESARYLDIFYDYASKLLFRVYSLGVQDTTSDSLGIHQRAILQSELWLQKKYFVQMYSVASGISYIGEFPLPPRSSIIGVNNRVIYTSGSTKSNPYFVLKWQLN
jgi:hypothetical protein